jgi:hypothetical protein
VVFPVLAPYRLSPHLFPGRRRHRAPACRHLGRHPETGFAILGFLDPQLPAGTEIAGTKVLGPFSQLGHFLTQGRPNRIVIGTNALYDGLPMDTLIQIRLAGVEVEEAADLYEAVFRRVSLDSLTPGRLIYAKNLWAQPAGVAMQSVWVNLLALALLLLLAPLLVLIAAAVKFLRAAQSSGPRVAGRSPFTPLRCARVRTPAAPMTTHPHRKPAAAFPPGLVTAVVQRPARRDVAHRAGSRRNRPRPLSPPCRLISSVTR